VRGGVSRVPGAAVGNGKQQDHPPQPFIASFTAWMISATSTAAPLGTPCGHVDACPLPRPMFTRLIMSLTATVPTPPQSPTHGTGIGVGVAVGETPTVLVTVPVAVAVNVGVPVAVCVGEGVAVGLGVTV
jgi:hypothetical protein